MATMSARYTVIDGEVVAQERGGVRHQLVPDPLGSTVALYDNTGTKTDTFGYWPYGESSGRTGTTNVKFQYVGALGYYRDDDKNDYIRSRRLNRKIGKWTTEDPIGYSSGEMNMYCYVNNNPVLFTDKSGNQKDYITPEIPYIPPVIVELPNRLGCLYCTAGCSLEIQQKWYPMFQHRCNPCYAHCMACCTITRMMHDDGECANMLQEIQNSGGHPDNKQWPGGPTRELRRFTGCYNGMRIAFNTSKTCHEGCSETFRWDNYPPSKNICRLDSHCADEYKKRGLNPGKNGTGIPGFPPLNGCLNVK